MKSIRSTVVVLLVLVTARISGAQGLPFTHFTSESETKALPTAAVTSVYQDRQGYVWLGNYGAGLVRYDGRSFEVYDSDDGLLNVFPWLLAEDASGRLWVRFSEGIVVSEKPLSMYRDDERLRFVDSLGTVPLLKEPENTQIASPFVVDGPRVWVSALEHGIIRYSIDGDSIVSSDTIRYEVGDPPQRIEVTSFVVRRGDAVWASTFNRLLAFDEPGVNTPREIDNVPCPRTVQMLEDHSGVLWGGCMDGTVWRLEGETFRVLPGLAQNMVTVIVETDQGRILVSSVGGGVAEVDPADPDHVTRYSRLNGMIDDQVWSVMEDREGNVWFGQNGGLSRLRFDGLAFMAYTGRSYTGERPTLPAPDVNSVLTDFRVPGRGGEMNLIVTGSPEGLALIREDGVSEHVGIDDGLANPIVLGICDDGRQNLWISTWGGFGRLDWGARSGGHKRIELFGYPVGVSFYDLMHSSSCAVLPIPISASSSETVPAVCFATLENVVCNVADQWYVWSEEAGLPTMGYWDVGLDTNGYVLVAGKDMRIYRSLVPITVEALRGLPWTPIRAPEPGTRVITEALFELALEQPEQFDGSLLSLATFGGSLWSVGGVIREITGNPPTYSRVIGEEQGLTTPAAAATYDDSTGVLWVGTVEGLYQVDLRADTVLRRITRLDGLISDNVWGPKAIKIGGDGNVYMGTPRGLAIYRPRLDRTNSVPPRAVIRMARIQQDNSGHNEVVFTYSALSFADERQVRYRTRLVGYDDDWSADTTEASIRYTNLNAVFLPREYTFEVIAANNDGVWSEEPARYVFSIRPAWWAAWPAFIVYGLMLGALVFAVDRVQRRRIIRREQEKARERELEQARQIERAYGQLKRTQAQLIQQEKLASLGQLTAGIAHEIKNPLNFVNNFSEASKEIILEIKQVMNENPDVRLTDVADLLEDLEMSTEKIEHHGKRADGIVRSMLMHARGSSGERATIDLNGLLDESVNLAYHSMRARVSEFKCAIERRYDPSLPPVDVIAQDIGRVFLNLLSNAFYAVHQRIMESTDSTAPTVKVSTKRAGDEIQVRIQDNGTGIPADLLEKIFEPFFTTKPAGQGTGLGLSLAYDIITQGHEGKLEVESEEGKGTTFTIHLPLVQTFGADESLAARAEAR